MGDAAKPRDIHRASVTAADRQGASLGLFVATILARAMLRRLIRARFGTVPEALGRRIDAADQEGVERLADRLAAASSLDALDAEAGGPA